MTPTAMNRAPFVTVAPIKQTDPPLQHYTHRPASTGTVNTGNTLLTPTIQPNVTSIAQPVPTVAAPPIVTPAASASAQTVAQPTMVTGESPVVSVTEPVTGTTGAGLVSEPASTSGAMPVLTSGAIGNLADFVAAARRDSAIAPLVAQKPVDSAKPRISNNVREFKPRRATGGVTSTPQVARSVNATGGATAAAGLEHAIKWFGFERRKGSKHRWRYVVRWWEFDPAAGDWRRMPPVTVRWVDDATDAVLRRKSNEALKALIKGWYEQNQNTKNRSVVSTGQSIA